MDLSQIIEALIFAAEQPLKPEQILAWWKEELFVETGEMDADRLAGILDGLQEKYQQPGFVFELRRIDGGYQFYTKRDFFPYLKLAAVQKNKKKLSRASLETLSIIAYRQPITKSEVEFIRGVSCDYAIRKLLDQKLIDIQGRSDAPGRPLLYVTSSYFMDFFGLNDLRDLPQLKEVSIDESSFKEQFKVYMKEQGNEEPGSQNGGPETE